MKIHQNQVSIQVANSTPMLIPPMTLAVIYSNAYEFGNSFNFSSLSQQQHFMLSY